MKRPHCKNCYFYEQRENNNYCNYYSKTILRSCAYRCYAYLDKMDVLDVERQSWPLKIENNRLSKDEKFLLNIYTSVIEDERLQKN